MKCCFLIWTIALTSLLKETTTISFEDIKSVLKEPFNLVALTVSATEPRKSKWIRYLIKQGSNYIKVIKNEPSNFNKRSNIFYFMENHGDEKLLKNNLMIKDFGREGPGIIMGSDINATVLREFSSSIDIGQQVYFVNQDDMKVFEAYSVNKVSVDNLLGWYKKTRGTKKQTFMWNPEMPSSVEKRRRNLYGKLFVAMSTYDGYYIKPHKDFYKEAKYHASNQTYEATNLLHGMHINFLKKLAGSMNFTYTLYRREDGVWGTEVDGKPHGMIENVYQGNAELIAAPYTNNAVRAKYVRFLPVIDGDTMEFFIKSQTSVGDLSFTTFLKPFEPILWMTVVVTVFVTAFVFWLSNTFDARQQTSILKHVLEYGQWLWLSFTANFGRKPSPDFKKLTSSKRMITVDPFQTLANALKTVSDSKSRVAAFFYKTEVLAREEYRCKVVLVPTNDISRTTFGFALSRNSSFYPYLSYGITQLLQQGHMSFEKGRNDVKQEQCDPLLKEAKPLTMQKLVAVFLFLIVSYLASMLLLATEVFFPKSINPKLTLEESAKRRLSKLQLKLAGGSRCVTTWTMVHQKLDELNYLLNEY